MVRNPPNIAPLSPASTQHQRVQQEFKKGEDFPHNIVTPEGVAAMYAYIVAASTEIMFFGPKPRQMPLMNDESVPAARGE